MHEKNEIWVSNPTGKDFKIQINHLPRIGDIFELEKGYFRVKEIRFRPITTEFEELNECVIDIRLDDVPEESKGEEVTLS